MSQHDPVHRVRQGGKSGFEFLPAAFKLIQGNSMGDQRIIHQSKFCALHLHGYDIFEGHYTGDSVAGVFISAAIFFADVRVNVSEIIVADDDLAACRTVNFAAITGSFQFNKRKFAGNIFANLSPAFGRRACKDQHRAGGGRNSRQTARPL